MKLFVTGSGSASKPKMLRYVAKCYDFVTTSDDRADAVGLARLAQVYLTGNSKRRCELEVVYRVKHPEPEVKKQYKKERINI